MHNRNKTTPPHTDIRWTQGEKKPLCPTPIFTVNSQKSISPRGTEKSFITIDAPDWVITVPVFEKDEALRFAGIDKRCFLFVEQWRHGAAQLSMEFPGGVIDAGEKPEKAAVRELKEETGFECPAPVFLGAANPNPALFCNTVYFFAAEHLKDTGIKNPDEDEFLCTHVIPVDEALKKAGRPPYIHALMTTALCLFRQYDET